MITPRTAVPILILRVSYTSRARTPKRCLRQVASQLRYAHQDAHVDRIRNIGIIAHVDAVSLGQETCGTALTYSQGKTTTTERMLYYSGVTQRVGGTTCA